MDQNQSQVKETKKPFVRLYIGGLAPEVEPKDIETKLSTFGQVFDVELAREIDGKLRFIVWLKKSFLIRLLLYLFSSESPKGSCRGFAFINIYPKEENSVQKCK